MLEPIRKPVRKRVLIAEDLLTTFHILKGIFEQGVDFEVIGQAVDGVEVVEMAAALKPDVITMDIQMPRQSGLQAIEQIMCGHPIPIIVVSAHADDAAMNVVFEALQRGAVDVINKPTDITSPEFYHYARSLRQKAWAYSEVRLVKRRPRLTAPSAVPTLERPLQPPQHANSSVPELIVLGASAGGPEALTAVLSKLPSQFPLPIVIGQHILSGFIHSMVGWLNQLVPLTVKVADDDEILRPGHVYFSKDEQHLLVRRHGHQLQATYSDAPALKGFKPSIDLLFKAAAETCANKLIGGIMTGMGSDGAEGLKQISDHGGATFVQDEKSSLIYGMPKVALEIGAAKLQLSLAEISAYLSSYAQHTPRRLPNE